MNQILTPVETRVMTLVSRGHSRAEIVDLAPVSLSGYNRAMNRVYDKTLTSTPAEAVAVLMSWGSIPGPDGAKMYTAGRVAEILRGDKVRDPIGDAERHLNDCLDSLARDFERGSA